MARPHERALKRKPMAVILLTTRREDVPNVPAGQGGHEFEWFQSKDGMHAYFDQNVEFHEQDTKDHDDMAYLAVEITDTKAEPMTVGRISVSPETDETKAWMKSIKDDITKAFQPVKEETKGEAEATPKVVRPRRKSSAAAAVKPDDSKEKAAALKKRLDAKKVEQKSESGDAPPAAKKTAAKKTSAATSKEPDIVVKKAATSPS